ncbi:TetR/AcrR family transcriptional regulator [Priestia megaterium]|uniref:TetR/AcrR family transcriptional regulator n=1 Tax=Priestia megaterium TaxID=1404 RepID=UPI001FB55C6F|nr:TetR/AcrR family transcriptional regulator [Priestia megaterium]
MDTTVDPRILRTRKLLMDAFANLTLRKDFKDITIKDITDEATVNRSTFYAHFEDKYELMETCISDNVLKEIGRFLLNYDTINRETISNIFMVLIKFRAELEKDLPSQCRRSINLFSSVYESKIKLVLENMFRTILGKQYTHLDVNSIKVGATILSASIYGATLDWKQNSSLSAEQYIQLAIPFIFQDSVAEN